MEKVFNEKMQLWKLHNFRDANARMSIYEHYKPVVEKITFRIFGQLFSIGLEIDDMLIVASSSLMRSITSFSAHSDIPFIAFMITRLRSDLFAIIRKQMTLSNKSTNTALMVDWQEEDFKQPTTPDPSSNYIEDEDIENFISFVLHIDLLSEKEKNSIIAKIFRKKKARAQFRTKQQLETTWQRSRLKIIRLLNATPAPLGKTCI